jgi:hypothetical protein
MGTRETSGSGDENISIDQDVWVEYTDEDLISDDQPSYYPAKRYR